MLKMSLIGNLGSDATLNQVSGKQVVDFNVAHTEKYKNNEGVEVNRTIWVKCAWWSEKSGIVPFLKKGTQVYLEGQPNVKTYTNNQGQTLPQLTLRVSLIQLLGGKQEQKPNQQNNDLTPSQEEFLKDDLPF